MATWSTIAASGSFMRDTNRDVFDSDVYGNTTSGSAVVSDVDTQNYVAGMVIDSVAFAADSEILTIDSATQFTIDSNATLTAERVLFNIEVMTDTQLSEMYKTTSKQIMYLDIVAAYSNDPDQSDLVDSIADTNEDRLNITLAYLQLLKYYQAFPGEEGSTNWEREQRYGKLYNDAKSGFRTLKTSTTRTIYTGRRII